MGLAQNPSGKGGHPDASEPDLAMPADEELLIIEESAIAPALPQRPRTLAAARERQWHLDTLKSTGLKPGKLGDNYVSVFDASCAIYDQRLFDALRQHYFNLMRKSRVSPRHGKLSIDFTLHADGHISGMTVTEGQDEDLFALFCRQTVLDLLPFSSWPSAMERVFPTNQNSVTITFYHHGELAGQACSKMRRERAHLRVDLSYPLPVFQPMTTTGPDESTDPYYGSPWFPGGLYGCGMYNFNKARRDKYPKMHYCKPPTLKPGCIKLP